MPAARTTLERMKRLKSWWVQSLRQAVLALGLATVAAPPANASGPATILVFGDSISAAYGIQLEKGWVALLQERLRSQGWPHRVVNASISGETTGGGLARLPMVLKAHAPDLVVIELGGNDGLRGYPVADVKRNLGRMIEAADPSKRQVLLVAMQIPPNYGRRYAQAFQALFAEVADAHNVPLVESFIDRVALRPDLMQSDGIHPNAAGQPALLEALWPAIEELLTSRTW